MTAPADPAVSQPGAVRRLFGRGSVYTLGTAVQMSTALLVVPILTRSLSAADYGEVAAGFVVLTILAVIGAAGLPDAAAREFFSQDGGPRNARRLVASSIAFAVAAGVLAHLTGPLWASALSLEYSTVLKWSVAAGVATSVLMTSQALLRAADRPWVFLGTAAVANVGGQALGLSLALILDSPSGYVAGLAGGTLLGACASLLITGSLRHGMARPAELRPALSIGLPLVPHGLAQYLVGSADRVAIAALLGLAAAGRYQVAYAVGSLGVILIVALNQAWLPLLLGQTEEKRWTVLATTSRAVHKVSVVVAGGLALSAPLAMTLAAPASFDRQELTEVGAVVALSMLPYATANTHFNAVFLLGATRVMAFAAPLAAVVNVALNLVLLPEIGLMGASAATVAAYALLAAVAVIATRRRVALPGVLRTALACWIVAVPFVAAGALLPSGGVGAAVRAALCALLVSAGALALLKDGRASRALVADEPDRQTAAA